MINLALRSEYSFKQTFGFIKDLVALPGNCVGIADLSNTYGHAFLEKQCLGENKKPIFGARLNVAIKPIVEKGSKARPRPRPTQHIFIAKNEAGLMELYELVKKAYEKYFYIPRIAPIDVLDISENIIVISEQINESILDRVDYIGLCSLTPRKALTIDKPKVAINNNNYIKADDREVYQLLAGTKRTGGGYSYNFDSKTYPQHILTEEEWYRIWKDNNAIDNTYHIASQCAVKIPKADRVKYKGTKNIKDMCIIGAIRKGINLNDPEYKARYEREIKLIDDKGFTDYFLIVAEMCEYAKKRMLVGVSRGSSAGSLVCYLMSITEIDPIKHKLLFERFIDENRFDFPDIDIDFHDKKRDSVVKYLKNKYGEDKVAHIANIVTFRAKSAIKTFASGLNIPVWETAEVKNSIIFRSGGDARAEMCLLDTFDGTDIGKSFIKQYPKMKLASRIEAHASGTSTHAAGILVCNDPITKYAGVHTRDDHAMLDKLGAKHLDMLKIDCLGLRTLSILEETCTLAGIDYNDLYSLPLDDQKAFDIFNNMRLSGIFQFEGQALAFVTRQIGVKKFNDIVAITALARPGAMSSGGTNRYIKYKLGHDKPIYHGDTHKRITGDTMGIVIYQEQMMFIAKEIANMSWKDVQTLRRATSLSLGDEFFGKFKGKFIDGALKGGELNEEQAGTLWDDISTSGSWTFNKSHAVSYGVISYWCAWAKANYPLEFAIATLNNTHFEGSVLRFLRDLVANEGFEYIPVDPDASGVNWSIQNGKLLGGLTNIIGIQEKKAEEIVKLRKATGGWPPGMAKKLLYPKTPYDILFPAKHYFSDFYDNPDIVGMNEPVDYISDIEDSGQYTVIGRVLQRDLRDRNDYQSVVKRGGRYVDNNQFYLKLHIEDDTDSILCMISPQDFDDLNGKMLAETSIEGETWYIVKGSVRSDWRMLTVENIFNLNEFVAEKDAIDQKDVYNEFN